MATHYGAADYIAAFKRVHDQLIAASVALLESMTTRPIMIAEYGLVEFNPVGTWKANWFADLFNVQLPAHPQIRAVIYQDGTDGGTDHRLNTSQGAIDGFKLGIAAPQYPSTYP